jgi:hypothetical protein
VRILQRANLQWILRETLPLVDELSADTVQKYVEKGTPFALFFYDSNKEGKLADARAIAHTVALDFRHQVRARACACLRARACVRVLACACLRARARACTCEHARACMHVHLCACACVRA